MRWKDKLIHIFRTLFRRKAVEHELDAELRFHLERQIVENAASGMSSSEARRRALVDFGGLEQMKEDCRGMRKANWIDDFEQDVRYALRSLLTNPGFAAVALLTLALGIGANTAIFSVVDAVLLKPLPFRHPEAIVSLWETESAPGSYPLTGSDYLDWRSQNTTFEDMSLYSWPNSANVSSPGDNEGATIVRTQANFFSLLGVPTQIGRTFAPGEDQSGGSHVAVLSHAFWKKHFAGQNDALGREIRLNDEPYTVIGVMPAWYRLPGKADLWVPLDADKEKLGQRGSHQWRAIGRIKTNATPDQARADLHAIARRLEKQYPDNNRNVDAIVTPMREDLVGNFKSQLWILFGAVGLVLLISCANVANLMLARSASRSREISVRSALGAGRGRLVRQLLTESILLSILGGSIGLALAYAAVSLLRSALPPQMPQPNPVTVGLIPLGFTFGVSVIVGVLFGLVPALQSTSVESRDALKSKGTLTSKTSRRGQWLRDALVVSEIALSLALLVGAGLLLRTFANLRSTDVGVRGEGVLTATVRLPETKYKTLDDARAFYDQLLQKLQAAPGIQNAALTTKLPLLGGSNGYIQIPGQQTDSMTGPLVEGTAYSGDYFRTMGIPVLDGREFSAEDHALAAKFIREVMPAKQEEAQAIAKKYVLPAVVNQMFARTFWPNQQVVGKVFESFGTFRIVGVVGDVKQQTLRGPAMPEAYWPLAWEMGSPDRPLSIVARSAGPPESLTATVRTVLQSLDPSLALMDVRTMPQIFAESMTDTRYETWLLGVMAALALILAAVGTFGVMSYVVGQRTNEIGIRMALGAGRARIVRMVLGQAGTRIVVGILLGLLGAATSARLMESLLVGVKPFDLQTYALVAGLLAFVALLACYLPVHRAMSVDPMVALRDE